MGDGAVRHLEEHERRRLGKAAIAAFAGEPADGGSPRFRSPAAMDPRGGEAPLRARRRRGRRGRSPLGRSLPAGLELPAGMNRPAVLVAAAAAWVAAFTATIGSLGVTLW